MKLTLNTNSDTCFIKAFYESHNNSVSTDTIVKLLPFLYTLGFKVFCPEDPISFTEKDARSYLHGKMKY